MGMVGEGEAANINEASKLTTLVLRAIALLLSFLLTIGVKGSFDSGTRSSMVLKIKIYETSKDFSVSRRESMFFRIDTSVLGAEIRIS
jgi:hypothetical protein